MKAYPYLSLIRCLVHRIFYFHVNVLLSQKGMIICVVIQFLKERYLCSTCYAWVIDVGSTTVKVVLLDEHDNYLYKSTYAIMQTFWTPYIPCFKEAQVGHEDDQVHVCITGSGG